MVEHKMGIHRRGDKVYFQWPESDHWVPARVIAADGYTTRVCASAPCIVPVNCGVRWLPVGTPTYVAVPHDETHFIEDDPKWNPYAVRPFLRPNEYRALGDAKKLVVRFRQSHFGAYMPATYYLPNDPVWVWEKSWLRATVIDSSRSWVNVCILDEYRDKKGSVSAKGYHPPYVWPVICDYPAPMLHIFTGIAESSGKVATDLRGNRGASVGRWMEAHLR